MSFPAGSCQRRSRVLALTKVFSKNFSCGNVSRFYGHSAVGEHKWTTAAVVVTLRSWSIDQWTFWRTAVLTSTKGNSLVTSEQVEAMAQVIWPQANSIAVTRTRPGRTSRGEREPEGFQLSISNDTAGLMAVISAESLDKLKTKLEQRTQKRKWGPIN